jgi:hypothetical protein
MNKILIRLMAILILASPFTFTQDNETAITPLTEAGENLDLQAVMELFQQAETEGDNNYLERKCERIDKEIDKLVYHLYGLTEEEIKIVEESVK